MRNKATKYRRSKHKINMGMKVKLLKSSEIDFNKHNGNFHKGYEEAEKDLSKKAVYSVHDYSGIDGKYFRLKTSKGELVRDYFGHIAEYYSKYFKIVK